MLIVCVGDNCIDLYVNQGLGYPGGGPVNFAAHASRLGARTAYLGAVGDDPSGRHLIASLRAEGVDTQYVDVIPGPSAVAYVAVEEGERRFLGSNRGVRERFAIDERHDELLRTCDLIHTTLDGCVDHHIPRWAAEGKAISYDFSHRAKPEQIDLLPHIRFAFASGQGKSLEEARQLAHSWKERGPEVVVVTRGEDGSIAYDGRWHEMAARRVPVIDTLGCGDAFMAGFIVEYLRSKSVPHALAVGTEVASGVLRHWGGFGYGKSAQELGLAATGFPTSTET